MYEYHVMVWQAASLGLEDLVHGDITKHLPQDILQFLGTVDHPKPCLGKHLVLQPEVQLSNSGEGQFGCGEGRKGEGEGERKGEGGEWHMCSVDTTEEQKSSSHLAIIIIL